MSAAAIRDEGEVRRLAEASAWRFRLAEDGVESSEAFEAWIDDPLNAAAWDQVQGPWLRMGEAATSPELMAIRAGALGRARRQGARRWRPTGAAGRMAAALAAVAVVAGAYGGWQWLAAQPQVYRTRLGERRVVPLADGSRISLDSGSEVRIRYSKDARKLELVSGQARFDVAHDVQRPFSVTARNQTVVATGTAFNVDLLGPKVMVTLIEGRVVVLQQPARAGLAAPASPSAKPPSVVLVAGQQLTAGPPAEPPQVATVNLDRATAWESGQLVFADEPLSSVAERVSRYAEHPVTVDAAAGAMRISGVFKSGDVATFVDVVTRYLPVSARTDPDGAVALQGKG